MYLHIGQGELIDESDIVGIFDIDNITVTNRARQLLKNAEKAGNVIYLTNDIPKSMIITSENKIFISGVMSRTLFLRSQGDTKFRLNAD